LSKLQQIAVEISKNKATATIAIEAPSDAIGRWIYQQLNEATVERVRARFEITSRVRVHLFY
ncbi:MAG TPA: N-acetylglucosaminyltransferase, partial [Gammaproteobacteria bacterium]|nr:N-acetylglucosaminyltransferase [Gammaproteobacteria bacterium]